MNLLISDANILIDLEEGQLIEPLFRLPFRFMTPDILFHEELSGKHHYLLELGLELNQWNGEQMMRTAQQVEVLAQRYRSPSRNDLFALVLAKEESCPLLTGDRALRTAAEKEAGLVHGTVWLVETLIKQGQISVEDARCAFDAMKKGCRRLPWELAEAMLRAIEADEI